MSDDCSEVANDLADISVKANHVSLSYERESEAQNTAVEQGPTA